MIISKFISSFNSTVWMLPPGSVEMNKNHCFTYSDPKNMVAARNMLMLLEEEEAKRDSEVFPYEIRNGDTMIFPIIGEFIPKTDAFMNFLGFISTISITKQLRDAITREGERLKRLILYIDSPGGVSIGIPELAKLVNEISKTKIEVIAFSDVKIASAGYYVGSGANRIITTPSTAIGAIGTILEIIKFDNNNPKTYLFTGGDLKASGHPRKDLSAKEMTFFSEYVTINYTKMIEDIALYRGVPIQEVKDTEGAFVQSFMNEWYVDGLVDSLEELINS